MTKSLLTNSKQYFRLVGTCKKSSLLAKKQGNFKNAEQVTKLTLGILNYNTIAKTNYKTLEKSAFPGAIWMNLKISYAMLHAIALMTLKLYNLFLLFTGCVYN